MGRDAVRQRLLVGLILLVGTTGCAGGDDNGSARPEATTAQAESTASDTGTAPAETEPQESEPQETETDSSEPDEPDSGSNSSGDGLGQIPTDETLTSSDGRVFEDAEGIAYRNARTVCRLFSVEDLAARYDVPAQPRAVAEAYAASAFPPERREPPTQGCIDGLTG